MKFCRKRIPYCLILMVMFLTIVSCGVRDNTDSASNAVENNDMEHGIGNGEHSEGLEGHSVAVADYHYLEMQWDTAYVDKNIALNEDWLYYAEVKEEASEGGQYFWCVFRNELSNIFQPEMFVTSTKNSRCVLLKALFLDEEGNCYLFWAENEEAESGEERGDPTGYFLEKYRETGELLWRMEYSPEEFRGAGENLTQGAAAEDGRIFLYQTGTEGIVFSIGEDGSPGEAYTPELEYLEGIAVGKDSQVYAYCVTGNSPKFVELGGTKSTYICPITPLQVYDGRMDGIYLCNGDGLWSYIPETGDMQKLWGWNDEYIQMDVNSIRQVFRADDTVIMMCEEQFANNQYKLRRAKEVETLVSVRFEDSSEYPGKQVITMEQSEYFTQLTDHTEYLVQRYNRQSKQYKVEILIHEGSYEDELKMQLLRGEGPDLIGLRSMDVMDLAVKGAFEDLADYYASSSVVGNEEILPAVRRTGTVAGKEVLVIPAFHIESLYAVRTDEMEQAAADWTPERFLELAQENRMFRVQSPKDVFWYCMGITAGEHFIDYEKKENYFDSEEFRNILEECRRLDTFQYGDCEIGSEPAFDTKDWEWKLSQSIHYEMQGFLLDGDKLLIGYPGWSGAESKLCTEEVFAMNKASKNKEGAWDFLEFLLSEELQSDIDWAFPARVDCFENCLKEPCLDPLSLEERQPTEAEAETARACVDAAVYDQRMGGDVLRDIISEEVEMYFAGDADLDKTVEKIRNRVQLYLNEL